MILPVIFLFKFVFLQILIFITFLTKTPVSIRRLLEETTNSFRESLPRKEYINHIPKKS